MCSGVGDWTCLQPGFPIRTSSNHSSVASSSRLIAGSYVLHRLLVPRHPPCALTNLTTDTKMLASTMQFSSYGRKPPGHRRLPNPSHQQHHPADNTEAQRFDRPGSPRGTRPTPVPSGPNSVPRPTPPRPGVPPHHPHPHRSTDTRSTNTSHDSTGQPVDVPPMSNHPGTPVQAVALDPPPPTQGQKAGQHAP